MKRTFGSLLILVSAMMAGCALGSGEPGAPDVKASDLSTMEDEPCQGDECEGIQSPVLCGDTTCEEGLVCCNSSCGICAPPDGVCTQEQCGPTD